jgi:SAM-dependent methyltransferase
MDLVVTSNVIEHINDDVEIMRQLHGVLSDYGVISVYVPAIPFLWTRMDDNVGHYRRYTITSLRKILESSGFSVKEIRYVDSVGGIATLFFRLKELMSRSNSYKPPSEGLLRFYDRYIWPASRIMDLIMNQYFGKNILAIASK